ncbi:MAG: AraC family transcriptional regulator [Firmicutes bacterium]|nr:AraC family transcriptional regulator [Bacillota bacterium]
MKFPIEITIYTYNEQVVRPVMPPHSHNTLEINYLLSGKCDLYCGFISDKPQKHIGMFPGNFVLIRPGAAHSINSDTQLKYFSIEFALSDKSADIIKLLKQSDYVRSFPAAQKILENWTDVLLFEDNQNLPDIFVKIRQILDERESGCFFKAKTEIILKQLFLSVISCILDEKTLTGQTIHIKKSLSYMHAHYAKNITLGDITGYTGISPTHLQRIFKETFGKAVIDKLNEIRINKAVQLLLNTNHPVGAISQMAGYNSPQAFLYNFKKLLNQTPSHFRQSELKKIIRLKKIDALNSFAEIDDLARIIQR